MVKNNKIFIALIFLYFLSLAIFKFFHFGFFLNIVGLFFIFIIPGLLVSSFLNIDKYFVKPFNLIAVLPVSIAILTIVEVVISIISKVYTPANQIFALVLITVILFLIIKFQKVDNIHVPKRIGTRKENLIFYLILAFPFLINLVSWLIYPFFPGDDTYTLAGTIEQSIKMGTIIQPVLERRPIFTPFILLVHYASGISVFSILQYVLPTVVMSSFLLPAALLTKYILKGKSTYLIFSLLFLSAPYLVFQIQYSIPQSFILLFSISMLIFSIIGLKNHDLKMILSSVVLGIVSILYHELGFVILFTSLIGLLLYEIEIFNKNRLTFFKKLIIIFLVVSPYLIILNILSKLKMVLSVFPSFTDILNSGLHWRWWYVNHYLNPDGIVFNYPGTKGLFWYAYLGALAFLFTVFLFGIIFLASKKLGIKRKNVIGGWVPYLPLMFFTLLFYFIAEIYPRISTFAFLPERAWIFLGLGIDIIFVLLIGRFLELFEYRLPWVRKALIVLMLFVILFGTSAIIYLSANRGILFSRKEVSAINFIKQNTPKDSVLVSTQMHSTGIATYSERNFVNIPIIDMNSKFNVFSLKAIEKYDSMIRDDGVPNRIVILTYDKSGQVISRKETKIEEKSITNMNSSVYLIYSLERFKKLQFIGSPKYLDRNDYKNRYKYFAADYLSHSIYHDNSVVIFKLR
ncbi:MAG: hypothetical protein Q7S37_05145 [bacterium]|nr:hypothetical protein [bacterium]